MAATPKPIRKYQKKRDVYHKDVDKLIKSEGGKTVKPSKKFKEEQKKHDKRDFKVKKDYSPYEHHDTPAAKKRNLSQTSKMLKTDSAFVKSKLKAKKK